MNSDFSALVSKVWNYAPVLRDQGISYGDYVEQITFLKIAAEIVENLQAALEALQAVADELAPGRR